MYSRFQTAPRRGTTRTRPGMGGMSDIDLLTELNQRMMDSVSAGINQLVATVMPTEQRRRQPKMEDCGCGCGCEKDRCYCNCCIGDVDLVVYAHAGERRIVTITLENSRRRAREIKLSLSNWTTRSGKATGVSGQLFTPAEFTLEPCQEENVVIAINAISPNNESDNRLPDVDECEVIFADLRVEGCDIRPIRIAVALLPRECDAYQVECGCGCC